MFDFLRLSRVAACLSTLVLAVGLVSPNRTHAQTCSLTFEPTVGGAVLFAGFDQELRVEIDPGLEFIRLENSELFIEWADTTTNLGQQAIRKFQLKAYGNEDQIGTGI